MPAHRKDEAEGSVYLHFGPFTMSQWTHKSLRKKSYDRILIYDLHWAVRSVQ